MNVDQILSCSGKRLRDPQGDEQRVEGVGDGVVDDGSAELMDPIGGGLDHGGEEVLVELDQERDDRAAGAREVVAPAAADGLDQAVGAEGPQPVAGLRGGQRDPVLGLLLGPELPVAEPGGTVREGEHRGQQGLLPWPLWPNSGIATPGGVRTGFDQSLIGASAYRTGDGREARPLQPFAHRLAHAGQRVQVGQALGGHEVGGEIDDELEAEDAAQLVVALQPVAPVEGLKQGLALTLLRSHPHHWNGVRHE